MAISHGIGSTDNRIELYMEIYTLGFVSYTQSRITHITTTFSKQGFFRYFNLYTFWYIIIQPILSNLSVCTFVKLCKCMHILFRVCPIIVGTDKYKMTPNFLSLYEPANITMYSLKISYVTINLLKFNINQGLLFQQLRLFLNIFHTRF